MNIDFDRLKYSLTGEYEEVMLEKQLEEKNKEIERLNNIINELEKTLEQLIEENLEGYRQYPENWEERRSVSNTWLSHRDSYLCILDYLRKLKDSDKE